VHFVKHVFPRIRAVHPDVQLRIVGRYDDAVAQLGSQTNVTVTGYVPRIEDELARSDVVIVPIRFGSGTRIKLLEAFAHRIPSVSTTLGAEGLDVVDGTHLLLADDDEAFASACVRLLRDLELRRALVNEAERLYLARYQWSQIHETVAELVQLVTSDAAKPET
jgi:glycosyltransferase involved in cell wall biosynthesis